MAFSIEHLKGVIGSHGGLAKNNLFSIILPRIEGTLAQASELNLLCKNVTLPSRQLNTLERNINGRRSKVANGGLTDDISMTFHVTNSMAVKEYFEAWMKLAYNHETRRAGYFADYAKKIQIKVLTLPEVNTTINTGVRIPDSIRQLSGISDFSLGPINADLSSGSLSLDFNQNTAQIITLDKAYPFTMNPIELGNETEGFMELTISFTYSEWNSEPGLANLLAGVNPF
jgi:hypothetical protein